MNLAALKRALTPGTVLDVSAHRHPALIGERIVVSANSVGFNLTLPDGHPRKDETPGGSHVDWPKADNLITCDDGALVIVAPEWGSDLMTFTIKESAQ